VPPAPLIRLDRWSSEPELRCSIRAWRFESHGWSDQHLPLPVWRVPDHEDADRHQLGLPVARGLARERVHMAKPDAIGSCMVMTLQPSWHACARGRALVSLTCNRRLQDHVPRRCGLHQPRQPLRDTCGPRNRLTPEDPSFMLHLRTGSESPRTAARPTRLWRATPRHRCD
jgi:hypothetical protein